MRKFSQLIVDRFIFSDYIDFSAKVREFSRALPETNQVDALGKKVDEFVKENIKANDIWLLVYSKEKNMFESVWPYHNELSLKGDNPIIGLVIEGKGVLVRDEIMLKEKKTNLESNAIGELQKTKSKIAVLIGDKNHLFGLILVGEKDNSKLFSESDIKCLKDLADTLAYGLPQVVAAQRVMEGWGKTLINND